MNAVTCGECPYHPQPIGLATEPGIFANKSFIAELGLLCPRDSTLVVEATQRACEHVTWKFERERRGK